MGWLRHTLEDVARRPVSDAAVFAGAVLVCVLAWWLGGPAAGIMGVIFVGIAAAGGLFGGRGGSDD